jgi:hypothetical protein
MKKNSFYDSYSISGKSLKMSDFRSMRYVYLAIGPICEPGPEGPDCPKRLLQLFGQFLFSLDPKDTCKFNYKKIINGIIAKSFPVGTIMLKKDGIVITEQYNKSMKIEVKFKIKGMYHDKWQLEYEGKTIWFMLMEIKKQ